MEILSGLVPALNPNNSYELVDLGPDSLDQNDDYNDGAIAVAKNVLSNPESFGILLCGSAIGVNIQANRFRGIRAVACYNEKLAELARLHNNANIICIPADFIDFPTTVKCIKTFLSTTPLSDEKYLRRNNRLDEVQE